MRRLAPRPVRIGVDAAAPYQSWVEGTGAAGFTVDLLNEAAHKRNINLQWVHRPEGPGPAFDARNIDMWPLVSSAFVNRKGAYAPPPFFENQYALAWQTGEDIAPSRSREYWKGHVVAEANLPVTLEMVNRAVPGLIPRPMPDRTSALQAVCWGQAEAAFMEVRLLETNLLRRPPGCGDKNFHVQFFHDIRAPMSLGALPEFKPEADELRDEIELMLEDGRYAQIADRWFLFSTLEGHAAEQIALQQKFRFYTSIMMAVMAVMILMLVWMYRNSRRAEQVAEAASRAKSEFLASVSHEVRTPMNGVIGMADLLLAGPLQGEQRQFASSILESAQLQLSILNDLLDSSKIDSGMLKLDIRPVGLADVAAEIVSLYRAMAQEQGLRLTATTSNLPNRVLADPLRLSQILGNLVSNAIKFTPGGGRVGLEIRGGDAAEASLETRTRVFFSVSDTGIGIPEESRARIFDSFTQVQTGATRRFGGTGLGLSISQGLVRRMGGSGIVLDSEVGAGSRFSFDLEFPIVFEAPGEPSEAEQLFPVAPVPAEATHLMPPLQTVEPILIVEDNRVNQRVMRTQIERLGLAAELAHNGLVALEKAAVRKYGAILMDCHMPEMDGWEATRRIRSDCPVAANRRIPIIAISASATEADRQAAAAAGMDDFLVKPYTLAELSAKLGQWLPSPAVQEVTPES
jgi:signal transduction histidine kinase/ActR/RegA family two-component response regulator